MTQRSYFWNGLTPGDAILSPYGGEELALIDRLKYLPEPSRQGVFGRNMVASPIVSLYPSAGDLYYYVDIGSGHAIINGYYYESDAVVTLQMAQSSPHTWWLAVLRASTSLQTVRLAIKGPYNTEDAAMNSVIQTSVIWEIPIATAYQKDSPTLPDVYDKRMYAIKHNQRRYFVPALGGYDATHATDLIVNSNMGIPLYHTLGGVHVNCYAYGVFCLDKDYADQGIYLKPCFIPLGVAPVGSAKANIGQGSGNGTFGYSWNLETHTNPTIDTDITPQIVNQPYNLNVDPTTGMYPQFFSLYFQRDATLASDTYTGVLFFSGWEVIYESFY